MNLVFFLRCPLRGQGGAARGAEPRGSAHRNRDRLHDEDFRIRRECKRETSDLKIPIPSQPTQKPSTLSTGHSLVLGLAGFEYADLHDPKRLADLTEVFYRGLESGDPALWRRFDDYRQTKGEGHDPVTVSKLLVEVGAHLGDFIGRLFGVDEERATLERWTEAQTPIFRFKKEFVQRRVLKKYSDPAGIPTSPNLEIRVSQLREQFDDAGGTASSAELATADRKSVV